MDASRPEPCKNYTVVMVHNATGKETFDLIQAHVVTKLKASISKGTATLARIAQKATFFHSNFSTMFFGEFHEDELQVLEKLPGVKYIEKWYAESCFILCP